MTKRVYTIERKFKQATFELEKEYNFGPLFHIDYTIIPWKKLPRLEKKFFIYESKQSGIDLGGRSIKNKLPCINRANLNWKELNEVFFYRMNSMLHLFPRTLFIKEMKHTHVYALALAKNTLDITTWLHPYEGIALTAGFRPRLLDWEQNLLNRKLGDFFCKDDINHLKTCLILREKPNTSYVDLDVMLPQALLLYQKAISYCKTINNVQSQATLSDKLVSIKLFEEYRIRSRAREAYSLLKNIRQLGAMKVSRNIAFARKGIQAMFCFHMLQAANQYIRKENHYWGNLQEANTQLNRLLPCDGKDQGDFVAKWENARAKYKRFREIIG